MVVIRHGASGAAQLPRRAHRVQRHQRRRRHARASRRRGCSTCSRCATTSARSRGSRSASAATCCTRASRAPTSGGSPSSAPRWPSAGRARCCRNAIDELGVTVFPRIEEAIEWADALNVLRLQLERMQAGFIPSLREYNRVFGVTRERLDARAAGPAHPASRPDEPRRRDRLRRGRRPAQRDPRPGDQRRGRAHGGALSAGGRHGPSWPRRRRVEADDEPRDAPTSCSAAAASSIRRRQLDEVGDVLLRDGEVEAVGRLGEVRRDGDAIDASTARARSSRPGFIDVHCHLREPGREDVETIATGARAAAAGGFTAVCAMPNTDPVTDNQAAVGFIMQPGASARGGGAGVSDRRDLGRPEGRDARRVRRDGRRRRGGGERRRQAGGQRAADAHRARVRAHLRHSGRRPLRGADARRRAAR